MPSNVWHAVEETSNAMALDGIMFEGVSVRVRRPTDYNPSAAAILGPSEPNPNLNVQAIGLQPGGSGMVSPSLPCPTPSGLLHHCVPLPSACHQALAAIS